MDWRNKDARALWWQTPLTKRGDEDLQQGYMYYKDKAKRKEYTEEFQSGVVIGTVVATVMTAGLLSPLIGASVGGIGWLEMERREAKAKYERIKEVLDKRGVTAQKPTTSIVKLITPALAKTIATPVVAAAFFSS